MKKALVLLLALTLVGGLAFAADPVTVSGNVQAQWGFDWDHGTSGFKGVVDGVQLKLTLPAINSSVKATGDEGATSYGEISVGNIRVYAESAYGLGNYGASNVQLKWDELLAKLVMGSLTVQFRGPASTDINYAGAKADGFWLTNAFDYDVYSGQYGATTDSKTAAKANSWESWNQVQFGVPNGGNWNYSFSNNYGVLVKYALPNMATIGLDVASYKAWDDSTSAAQSVADTTTTTYVYWDDVAGMVTSTTDRTLIHTSSDTPAGNDFIISSSSTTTDVPDVNRFAYGDQGDNAYTGRLTVDVSAVPGLTAQAGAAVGYVNPGYATGEIGFDFGGRVAYALKLSDTISITPGAAADVKTQKNYLSMYSAAGVTAAVMGAKVVANAGFAFTDADTNVAWPLTTPSFAATITADAGSLVPNLTAKAAFEWVDPDWNNVGLDETYAIFGQLGYKVAVNDTVAVTPWLKVSTDNKDDSNNTTAKPKKATAVANDNDDPNLFAKVGVDVTGLLKNTTFTVKWDSNDLQQANVYNPLKMGEIVVIAKISF